MQVQSDSKPYDDINITPMLDLAYVLLVIFIIMTTATVQGQKVALLAMLEALVGEPIRPVDGEATHVEVTARDENDSPWEQTYLVRANKAGIETLETFNKYDRVAWLPTLLAQAKGNYNSNKALVNTNWTFDVMVGAQWNLFDRGQRLDHEDIGIEVDDAGARMPRTQMGEGMRLDRRVELHDGVAERECREIRHGECFGGNRGERCRGQGGIPQR